MVSKTKRGLCALALLVLAPAVLWAVPATGQAAKGSKWYARAQPFRVSRAAWAEDQGVCASSAFTGRIRYEFREHRYAGDPHTYFEWRNPRLVGSRIRVRFSESCTAQFPASQVPVDNLRVRGRVVSMDRVRSCGRARGLPSRLVGVTGLASSCDGGSPGLVWGEVTRSTVAPVVVQDRPAVLWRRSGSFDTFHDENRYPVHCFRAQYETTTHRAYRGEFVGVHLWAPASDVCVDLYALATS